MEASRNRVSSIEPHTWAWLNSFRTWNQLTVVPAVDVGLDIVYRWQKQSEEQHNKGAQATRGRRKHGEAPKAAGYNKLIAYYYHSAPQGANGPGMLAKTTILRVVILFVYPRMFDWLVIDANRQFDVLPGE